MMHITILNLYIFHLTRKKNLSELGFKYNRKEIVLCDHTFYLIIIDLMA